MSIAELKKLPPTEKLRIIEALWDDLNADGDTFQSPEWHRDELREIEAKFTAGHIKSLDWSEAKQELCKRSS